MLTVPYFDSLTALFPDVIGRLLVDVSPRLPDPNWTAPRRKDSTHVIDHSSPDTPSAHIDTDKKACLGIHFHCQVTQGVKINKYVRAHAQPVVR